jgi:myo-inositol-1(or 4)-monophosphatase
VKNLDDLLMIAQEAVEIGATLLTTSNSGNVHYKGDRDLITDLDLQIQR